MSIFGTLDCSFSSQVLQKARTRGYSMLLHPVHCANNSHTFRRHRPTKTSSPAVHNHSAPHFEKIFIRALVQAGQCHNRALRHKADKVDNERPSDRGAASNTSKSNAGPFRRHFSARTKYRSPGEAVAVEYNASRDELNHLVDYYPSFPEELMTSLTFDVSAATEPSLNPQRLSHRKATQDVTNILAHLRCLLEDKESPHEDVFDVFSQLPYPRTQNLPKSMIRTLLLHLSVVEHKSHASMLRYLAVVEDLKAAGIPLTISEWTSAISFTGRCLKKISAADVELSLTLWREMEHEAGIQANNVTFNVLFDIATKAGKFVLAEMIMKEMQRRGLSYNRYFRTSLIYHYGLRADGDGVRRAYRELVEAGEIVDATVIACVIASLLKCGEAVAAEQVFERAKHLHAEKTDNPLPPPPQDWRERRSLGRSLVRAASQLRGNSEAVVQLQQTLSLAPDLRAYKALIYYHAVTAGDLDRVTELLSEMDYYSVPLHGSIFLYLLKGFGMHGGVLYTSWTRRKLENTWAAFRQALSADGDIVYMSRAAAIMTLRAFAKCAPYERTLDVWNEIQRLWEPSDEDTRHVVDVLQQMHEQYDEEVEEAEGEEDEYV